MIRSSLLFIISLVFLVYPEKINSHQSVNKDSVAIQHWVKPILDSIFINPKAVLPWLDSLNVYADTTQNAYAKLRASILKGNYYWAINHFDTAIMQYHNSVYWAQRGGYKVNEINAMSNIALVYNTWGNFDSASLYYLEAIEKANQYQLHSKYIQNIISYSSVLNNKGSYTEAVSLLEKARLSDKTQSNAALRANLHTAMGNVFYNLGRIERMHQNYRNAISYHLEQNNNQYLASLYINMAESFTSFEYNHDSASYYFTKALHLGIPRNREGILQMIDVIRANRCFEEARYDSAAILFQRALDNPRSKYFPRLSTALTINLGNVYLETGDFNKAWQLYQNGYKLADSFDLLEYKKNALRGIVKIDSTKGRFRDAFVRTNEYQRILNKLNKDYAHNRIVAFEIERELEFQKLRNDLLNSENAVHYQRFENQRRLNMFIVIALIGTILFTIFQYISQKKIRKLNLLLELNIQKLDKQNLELENLNQTKDKFFSIISHDLRGPIATIQASMSLLRSDWDSLTKEEKKKMVVQLEKSSENTLVLLEDLLQWSQLQQGMMRVNPSTFSIQKLFVELVDIVQFSVESKKQKLQILIKSDIYLTTDYQILKQILLNFLINANKFTARGGELKLEAQFIDEAIKLTIRDSGIGIPKDKQKRIFDLDVNFGRPGTEGEKSSGMGLMLCRDYAVLLGAELQLESEPDKGSAFSILLNNLTESHA